LTCSRVNLTCLVVLQAYHQAADGVLQGPPRGDFQDGVSAAQGEAAGV
jgi:hypothetical protein